MAKESVAELYLSLGIDLSKLESDYLKADETVSQNMRRLQNEIRNTKLEMKVDMTDINLSEAERLEKAQQNINHQIDLQRQKVELATKAWQAEVEATNAESAAAQKLQQNMLREQLSLNNMQGQRQQYSTAQANPAKGIEAELAKLQGNTMLIDAMLGTQMASYLSAITARIDLLKKIDEKVNSSMKNSVSGDRGIMSQLGTIGKNMPLLTADFILGDGGVGKIKSELSTLSAYVTGSFSGLGEKIRTAMAPAREATALAFKELSTTQIFRPITIPPIKFDNADIIGKISSVTESFAGLETVLSTFGRAGIVAAAFTAIGEAIVKMAHPAIAAGESIYRLQQHMHASTADAVAFNNIFKISGGSAESTLTSLMRLDKSIRTAGSGGNEATRALAAFGVSLQNDNGVLLPYNQQLEKLAQGYQRAKAAGLEEEYVTATLGVRGREMISVLEDYTELQDKASQIKGTGMINPEMAHELEHESNLLSAEWGQLGTAFSAALQPAAAEILPSLIALLQESVTLISDHKEAVFAVSTTLGKLISLGIDFLTGCIKLLNGVCNLIGLCADGIMRITASLEGFDNSAVDSFYEKLKKIVHLTGSAKGFNPIDEDAQSNALDVMNASNANKQDGNRYMTDSQGNSYNLGPKPDEEKTSSSRSSSASEESRAAQEAQRQEAEAYNNWVQSHNRGVQMIDQANQILFHNEHQYMHTAQGDYENAVYDVKLWEWQTQQTAKSAEEAAAVHQLAAAKMAQAYQAVADKIKSLNESLQDKIFKLTHDDYDNKMYDLKKDIAEMRRQGADEGLINDYYNASVSKYNKDYRDQYRKDHGYSDNSGNTYMPFTNASHATYGHDGYWADNSRRSNADYSQPKTQQVSQPVNVTVNVNGAWMDNDSNISKVTDKVAEKVSRQIQSVIGNRKAAYGR